VMNAVVLRVWTTKKVAKTPFNTKNAAKDLDGKKTCKDAKPTLFTLSKICEQCKRVYY
jgi:hypothetical protein